MDISRTEYNGKDFILIGVRHFNLAHTLDCGQCFRFQKNGDVYTGIAHNRYLELESYDDKIIFKDTSPYEFETIWKDYFDFNRDYGRIHSILLEDKSLREAINYAPGIRVMRQDPWETLISFILSQNNNIPRIKGSINRLAEAFGTALPGGGYTFPTAQTLALLSPDDLAPLRCGYRTEYIIDAAKRVHEGRFNFDSIEAMFTDEARSNLLKIHGVGPKVADCTLLYGFGRVEVYPMDVWMKRVMSSLYPAGFPEEIREVAGIAQQFLFHYVRACSKSRFR